MILPCGGLGREGICLDLGLDDVQRVHAEPEYVAGECTVQAGVDSRNGLNRETNDGECQQMLDGSLVLDLRFALSGRAYSGTE